MTMAPALLPATAPPSPSAAATASQAGDSPQGVQQVAGVPAQQVGQG